MDDEELTDSSSGSGSGSGSSTSSSGSESDSDSTPGSPAPASASRSSSSHGGPSSSVGNGFRSVGNGSSGSSGSGNGGLSGLEFIPLGGGVAEADTAAPAATPQSATKAPAPLLGWTEAPWKTREYSETRATACAAGGGGRGARAVARLTRVAGPVGLLCRLHEEVLEFGAWIEPTAAERRMREGVLTRLREVAIRLWPASQLRTFGSMALGVYLPTSDIDVVLIGEWQTPPMR